VAPLDAERACYEELAAQVRTFRHLPGPDHRLALHHLLEAAGSCPAAAVQALDHFLRQPRPPAWAALRERYAALSGSSKLAALTELLGRNPTEKSIVFVRHRATLEWLARHLAAQGCALSTFDGALSGPQKDRAIEAFRDRDTVLLCTECGGEGRNLQFCNTLVNFDLPWNPQEIEQRIGRLHRIGQPREVFVFNFAVRHTIEERVLQILGEKINMFELVVGEIQAILGEMEDTQGFAERVFAAWMEETDATRAQAFDRLGDDLVAARRQYDGVKAYDEELFADDFEAL
jgi:SNF2 family DNA or RNA helicase